MRVGTAKPRNGPIDPREVLPAAARERGDTVAALSRMPGRWPGYLQTLVHDGVPRAFSQRDHDLLSAYFGKPMGLRDVWAQCRGSKLTSSDLELLTRAPRSDHPSSTLKSPLEQSET